MTKILFDASVHLGQFLAKDEESRVACKNSQARIVGKNKKGVVGICTYNENSVVDDFVWGLKRAEQDVFYPFMDLFHSVKNIKRISLSYEDIKMAQIIGEKCSLSASAALSCAVAVRENAVIETLYPELLNSAVRSRLWLKYGLKISEPERGRAELVFKEAGLEVCYQNAKQCFVNPLFAARMAL